MTNLQFPIAVMRDDANNIRASAENISDPYIKKTCLDRADQCDLAVKILELYVKLARD